MSASREKRTSLRMGVILVVSVFVTGLLASIAVTDDLNPWSPSAADRREASLNAEDATTAKLVSLLLERLDESSDEHGDAEELEQVFVALHQYFDRHRRGPGGHGPRGRWAHGRGDGPGGYGAPGMRGSGKFGQRGMGPRQFGPRHAAFRPGSMRPSGPRGWGHGFGMHGKPGFGPSGMMRGFWRGGPRAMAGAPAMGGRPPGAPHSARGGFSPRRGGFGPSPMMKGPGHMMGRHQMRGMFRSGSPFAHGRGPHFGRHSCGSRGPEGWSPRRGPYGKGFRGRPGGWGPFSGEKTKMDADDGSSEASAKDDAQQIGGDEGADVQEAGTLEAGPEAEIRSPGEIEGALDEPPVHDEVPDAEVDAVTTSGTPKKRTAQRGPRLSFLFAHAFDCARC
ncbi:MAG: hypothetical protein MI757_08660 [Pirellulales bacterium]|nr:hypothetical protein [Pirellulales bacterium]